MPFVVQLNLHYFFEIAYKKPIFHFTMTKRKPLISDEFNFYEE